MFLLARIVLPEHVGRRSASLRASRATSFANPFVRLKLRSDAMVVVSYSGREINAKIVYYGPGLCGKTTNLEKIYDSVPETHRGRMVSMKTQTDRTLFFDLLPLDLGELQGMKTRFLLYTVPGQVYYNATRKLVLKGVDAVVFVADSAPDKMAENRESLANLEANLKAYGLDLRTIPWVLQYNKRDLPNALSVEEMNRELNAYNVPTYEAQAVNGGGVFETLRGVSKLLLAKIAKDVTDRDRGSHGGKPRVADGKAEGKPAAADEAPISSLAPSIEEPSPLAAPAAPEFLPEDAVLEETPAESVVPAPSAADEAMVLSDADFVREEDHGPAPRASTSDDVFGDDEIERETSYEAFDGAPSSVASDARRITVPIDLGKFPPSGKLKVTFEVRIELEEEPKGGRKKSGRSSLFEAAEKTR
jgi:signal recognition particle receptor subunit beta